MQSLRLMVVDADDFSATLTGAALSNLGHRVVKFANASIALQALNEGAGAYDAVFASRELDTMTGLQFAREAQRCDARLRLLASDGDSGNVIVLPREHLLANPGAMQCLQRAAEHSLRAAA